MTVRVEASEQRRILTVLVVAQMFSGAGLAAGVTVGALLAQDMFGSAGWAGLPIVAMTVGAAASSVLIGNVSQAAGRRMGLVLGFAAGSAGAVGIVASAITESATLFFASFAVYGAGTAANLQARYAGADLASPDHKGRAISTVLVATTFGAVAGPNLVSVMGSVARDLGIPELSGPFVLSAVVYGLGALILLAFLRPDPLLRARELDLATGDSEAPVVPIDTRGVRQGAIVMAISQLLMVAIMTMTPVHLQQHHHGLGTTGFIIGLHIAAMFLPSPLTGYLVDRWGPRRVAMLSGLVLAVAGVVGATAPPSSAATIAVALMLVGLGWNLGLVSGTTFVAQATSPAVRARVQGRIDMAISIAGAGAAFGAGPVVAGAGYAVLSAGAAVVALVSIQAVRGSRTPENDVR